MAVNRFSPIQGLPEWKPAIPLETLYKALVYKKELFDKSKMQIEQNIAVGKNLADSILITDVRDKFKKDLNERIQKLNNYYSMADLSNPDIVTQINSEFKPIVEDEEYTRALKLSNEARNNYSTLTEAKKKNEGYNQLHETGFMLDFEDFQNAKYGSLSSVSAPTYRMYKDPKKYITENLMKNYKTQKVVREVPDGWYKRIYEKEGYFYDDVKNYIELNLPQEYRDQLSYQANVEAKIFNKNKNKLKPEDVNKFYNSTLEEYNTNIQDNINKLKGDIKVQEYNLTQIKKDDPTRDQKIQEIRDGIEKRNKQINTLSEELVQGTYIDDKLPMMLSVNKTNKFFKDEGQANSYITSDIQKLDYNTAFGEQMKYSLDSWYKQKDIKIREFNADTERIKALKESKTTSLKMDAKGNIILDGNILTGDGTKNLNSSDKTAILNMMLEQQVREEQSNNELTNLLITKAEVALYDQMTPEAKRMYDEKSKDPDWKKSYLEQSLFNNYQIFKKNTWDSEGKSKNGMKMSKSLIKFFETNSQFIGKMEDDNTAATKILNTMGNVSTLDSQGKKFTTSQLNKLAILASKEGLNLEGTDANTAEDVTDLLNRVRQFVKTGGKSMNPMTEDESGFMGGMATALDYVTTSLSPGGEYSSTQDVKKIVAQINGKLGSDQLTMDDFKNADKTLSDLLLLYGMNREEVMSGKNFSGNTMKILAEGIIGYRLGKMVGGNIPFMKKVMPTALGIGGAYVFPKLDPTNYAPSSYLNNVFTGSNPEGEKFEKGITGLNENVTVGIPEVPVFNINLPTDKDQKEAMINDFVKLANSELISQTQSGSVFELSSDLVTPTQMDGMYGLYFSIKPTVREDIYNQLKSKFGVNQDGNTIRIQLSGKQIDVLDKVQNRMYEEWSLSQGRTELPEKYAQVYTPKNQFNIIYRGAVSQSGAELQFLDMKTNTYFPLMHITEKEALEYKQNGLEVFATDQLLAANSPTQLQEMFQNFVNNISAEQNSKLAQQLENVLKLSRSSNFKN